MKKYWCNADDGNGAVIVARDSLYAAKKYVKQNYLEECRCTLICAVYVAPYRRNKVIRDEGFELRIVREPEEPKCTIRGKHKWVELITKCSDGPGVIIKHECSHCKLIYKINTGAQDPCTGKTYTAIYYLTPDDDAC